jgi:antitoxin component of RelBE/YafQ-DinJ toxin-antitoxin module
MSDKTKEVSDKVRKERITVRLDPEDILRLKSIAEEFDIKLSKLVRMTLMRVIKSDA